MISGFGANVTPRILEEFLLSVEDVADASVWFDENSLRAQVTLNANSFSSEAELAAECAKAFGKENVPTKIIVMGGRARAVVYVSQR